MERRREAEEREDKGEELHGDDGDCERPTCDEMEPKLQVVMTLLRYALFGRSYAFGRCRAFS